MINAGRTEGNDELKYSMRATIVKGHARSDLTLRSNNISSSRSKKTNRRTSSASGIVAQAHCRLRCLRTPPHRWDQYLQEQCEEKCVAAPSIKERSEGPEAVQPLKFPEGRSQHRQVHANPDGLIPDPEPRKAEQCMLARPPPVTCPDISIPADQAEDKNRRHPAGCMWQRGAAHRPLAHAHAQWPCRQLSSCMSPPLPSCPSPPW